MKRRIVLVTRKTQEPPPKRKAVRKSQVSSPEPAAVPCIRCGIQPYVSDSPQSVYAYCRNNHKCAHMIRMHLERSGGQEVNILRRKVIQLWNEMNQC